MADLKEQAVSLKKKGNSALQEGNVDEAIQLYSEAIKCDPENAALFSNRSAAYCMKKKFMDALTDAETSIQLDSKWAKGYSRKGAALAFMNRHEEAVMAYEETLKINPDNDQAKQAIEESKSQLTGPGGSQPLMNPFSDPQLFAKLEKDPKTKEFLKDPDYRSIIEKLQKNPKELGQHIQDSRVMTTLGSLLGVQMEMADENVPMQTAMNGVGEMEGKQEQKEPATSKSSQPEPMDTASSDQEKAQEEKTKGNEAYKKKDFEAAIEHYDKAIELDPTNITFYTNKAAVYFEQKKFEECIKGCERAVEVGRENAAEFKLIGKALARIGKAYYQLDDLDKAIVYYNKSLAEHRDRQIAITVAEAEKEKKEREKRAYINPELAEEEKAKGNECFKKGNYPDAVKHYTEAIRRNPEDCKLYSNRAACYTKLAAFNEALKDAEECVKIDPKFVKGYLRKGNVLLTLKENEKAGDAFQKAMEIDPNCKEAVEGYRKSVMQDSSDPEAIRRRAMANPEVQQILADPAMQLILQQMQKDPKALQEHLKDPEIAKKIEKLLESGLISIR